jgi:hypothetical protein
MAIEFQVSAKVEIYEKRHPCSLLWPRWTLLTQLNRSQPS